jgi:hypothetical protein
MCGPAAEPILETPQKKAHAEEHDMFTDPDIFRSLAKQRSAELIAEAKRERLARSFIRSRRGRSPDGRGDAR